MSIIELGIYSGFLTLFLNYTIGKPSSEFSPYEIFSGYSVWLAKRRLKKVNLYEVYKKQIEESKGYTVSSRIELQNDFKKIIYNAAEPFFTWERAAGICPVCTGVWVSLIVWAVFYIGLFGLVYSKNILDLLLIILISHIVIRLLNKIL